jgi:hypothetical protein
VVQSIAVTLDIMKNLDVLIFQQGAKEDHQVTARPLIEHIKQAAMVLCGHLNEGDLSFSAEVHSFAIEG